MRRIKRHNINPFKDRKVIFGDSDLIRDVKVYEREQERIESSNEYEVVMEFSGRHTTTVHAESEQEASELAEFDSWEADIDRVRVTNIRKILPDKGEIAPETLSGKLF